MILFISIATVSIELKPRQQINVFVPENFNIKQAVGEQYWKHEDSIKWLLGAIYFHKLMRFSHDRRARNPSVNLKKAYLDRLLPCRKVLTPIIHNLEHSGAITCDHKAIEGQKCFSYGLGPLFSQRFKLDQITNKFLIKNLHKWQEQEEMKLSDLQKRLKSFLLEMEIDTNNAVKSIEGHKEFDLFRNQILAIHNKSIFFHQDDFGRIHSNLTNLLTQLRQFITVHNRHLAEIDICNSQPLFLSISISNPNLYNTDGSEFHLNQLFAGKFPPHPFPPFTINLFDEFKKHCESGQIYDEIGKEINKSRDWVKHKVLRVIYCNHKLWEIEKVRENEPEIALVMRTMERMYPEVMGWIKKAKEKNYAFLAQNLQRMEAYYIFKRVCRRIINDYPSIWIATIHDSICCLPEDVPLVKMIMEQEFACLNTKAVLKVKLPIEAAAIDSRARPVPWAKSSTNSIEANSGEARPLKTNERNIL